MIAARQFGLGQVPPSFFLHSLAQSRADLPYSITAYHCYHMFDELMLPIPMDLSLTVACEGFDTWWGMWLSHVFRCPLAPRLLQIDADHEASDCEVTVLGTPFYPSLPSGL